MDSGDPAAAARALIAGLEVAHRITLPRDWRRRAIPARSARPRDVTIAAAPGGVWLDIAGRAGILFDPDQWAQLTLECVALLLEVTNSESPA